MHLRNYADLLDSREMEESSKHYPRRLLCECKVPLRDHIAKWQWPAHDLLLLLDGNDSLMTVA